MTSIGSFVGSVAVAISIAFACSLTLAGAQRGTTQAKVKIELPDYITEKHPIYAEFDDDVRKGKQGETFRHVVFSIKDAGQKFYLRYVSDGNGARLEPGGPEKTRGSRILLMIGNDVRSPQLAPLKVLGREFFENLKFGFGFARETSAVQFFPLFDENNGPFIFACSKACKPENAPTWEAYKTADLSHSGSERRDSTSPDQNQKDTIHVYAYDLETGKQIGGPHVVVLPSCDTSKLRSGVNSATIDARGRDFDLPFDPKNRIFCLHITDRDPQRATYQDYRCDIRPRGAAGTITQAPIAWSPKSTFWYLPTCPSPPPRSFQVKVFEIDPDVPLESARSEWSRGALVSWLGGKLSSLTIYSTKPKIEGATIRWEAPGMEVPAHIPSDRITSPHEDYEVVQSSVVGKDEILILLRRKAIAFADLSFQLTDEAGNLERNCVAYLQVPRRAVRPGRYQVANAETLDVSLWVGADDNKYFPTLDSQGRKTPEAKLSLPDLPDRLTLAMKSGHCQLDGPTYQLQKSALWRGPVPLVVAPAHPLLNIVLWPDREFGKHVSERSQRERIWSEVIIKALQDAVKADKQTDRWRQIRISRRENDNVFTPIATTSQNQPIPEPTAERIVNEMTDAADGQGGNVVVRFDDSFFKRLSEASSSSNSPKQPLPQVVVLAGQTADRIKYCGNAETSFRFLQNYPKISTVVVDMVSEKQEGVRPIDEKTPEVVTCANPAATSGQVRYVAILVPNSVSGPARWIAAREQLTKQLRLTFEAEPQQRAKR